MQENKMQENAIIKAENLSVQREGFFLLKDVSLTIEREQIISVIGPNGGGKTTLARVLANIIKPEQGKVTRVKGLRVGYVPQYFETEYLMPLSVKFFLQLSPCYTKASVHQAVSDLDIEHLLDRQFSRLSGGEKQRVLLARAILGYPQLLILDEPTQALDMDGSINFYNILREYVEKHNCSVLIISHDLHFVMSATDLVVCLHGHICCQGTPQEIDEDPIYRKLFGRNISESLALYHHSHNHIHR